MAEQLNADKFAGFVANASLPVLVDFYRDGCIPCRRVAPLLSKAESVYAEKLIFARVNAGQSPALAEQYGIEAAPTLVLFQNGEEIARHRGVISRDELTNLIENNT